jgi:large subunit ribosomal protein L3
MTTKRVGLIGKKVGMRREVDLWGNVHPVTLIQIQANTVLQVKTPKDHQSNVFSIQVGAGLAKWHSLSKAVIGHLTKVDADPKEKMVEFRVTPDAIVPAGTELLATHFVVGQFVDVTGTTKGKGTAGVVKLHGFGGGRASHGASRDLRKPGSIASGNTSPARVFRGHPMAGRMGHDRRTVLSLQILKINTVDSILYVRGPIPGPEGAWLEVRDARRKPHKHPPPFPTHLPDQQPNRPIPKRKYLRLEYADPYEKQREIDWEVRWNEARAALKSAQAAEGAGEDEEEGAEGAEAEAPAKTPAKGAAKA